MKNNLEELQKELEIYFENINNIVFVSIVKCFVYHHDSSENSEFVTFLKDHNLENHFPNYLSDLKGTTYFKKCPDSAVFLIEDIQKVLLSIAFHRFTDFV